ncbi:putative membrane protein [Synechococcus sp. NOUM97013]|nr:putative membrane protein [Synechococcus sp. NOUM97013]
MCWLLSWLAGWIGLASKIAGFVLCGFLVWPWVLAMDCMAQKAFVWF